MTSLTLSITIVLVAIAIIVVALITWLWTLGRRISSAENVFGQRQQRLEAELGRQMDLLRRDMESAERTFRYLDGRLGQLAVADRSLGTAHRVVDVPPSPDLVTGQRFTYTAASGARPEHGAPASAARMGNQTPQRGDAATHDSSDLANQLQTPFTRENVAALYERWCLESSRPSIQAGVEFVSVQHSRSDTGPEFGAPDKHILADSSRQAEFVRFSPTGGNHGLLYPNPDAHYSPALAFLFKGLTPEMFEDRAQLAQLTPVEIRRRQGNEWELV